MSQLVACPVCQRRISTAAAACPGCGHPRSAADNADSRHDVGRTIGKVATVAGAAYVLPWIVRLIVAVVAIVVFGYFIFR